MIISRTPFRISFFGGGTDFPEWFNKNNGSVISTTIDKYCYISLRDLPPFFEHKHRLVYSKIESVNQLSEIEHPVIREAFMQFKIKSGMEVHHDGDLPARSGLGSSSSFTAGLINALNAYNGMHISKEDLAKQSINLERNNIGENVGYQDQIAVTYGGLNRIDFSGESNFKVSQLIISEKRKFQLQDNLMLFFTGLSRYSSTILKKQIENIPSREQELNQILMMVNQAQEILIDEKQDLDEFGNLLHQSWEIKKNLSDEISSPYIDRLYSKAIASGALGGKILGAGGGGFMLFYVPKENQLSVQKSLSELVYVPISFSNNGSEIVLYQPNGLR